MTTAAVVVAVLALAAAGWCELRRRRLAARLAELRSDGADDGRATAGARERRWLHHLAWVTAVQARTPSQRALDDLLKLRSTRVEVMEVGERHLLDGAIANTEQALRLHDDLRRWATTPTVGAEVAPVALRTALDKAVADLDDDGRATLDVHALPTVLADEALLATALHAALDNCVRYRWPGRPVHVTITAEQPADGRVVVHVQDDGLGVDTAVQDELFLPFTRGSGAAAMPGVGLGLPTLARALEAMDGSARFVPHEGGRGSTLAIELPAA